MTPTLDQLTAFAAFVVPRGEGALPERYRAQFVATRNGLALGRFRQCLREGPSVRDRFATILRLARDRGQIDGDFQRRAMRLAGCHRSYWAENDDFRDRAFRFKLDSVLGQGPSRQIIDDLDEARAARIGQELHAIIGRTHRAGAPLDLLALGAIALWFNRQGECHDLRRHLASGVGALRAERTLARIAGYRPFRPWQEGGGNDSFTAWAMPLIAAVAASPGIFTAPPVANDTALTPTVKAIVGIK